MRHILIAASLLVVGTAAVSQISGGRQPNIKPPDIVTDPDADSLAHSPDRIALGSLGRQPANLEDFVPAETRTVLKVNRRFQHGDFIWNEANVPPGNVVVTVDLRRQLISVFRGGHEIGTAVILYGADEHETPLGTYPVRSKTANYRSVRYDAPMPFALWLTDDGVAIHASDVRRGRATHGCIGVPPLFARHLFDAVEVGDRVVLTQSPESASALAPV